MMHAVKNAVKGWARRKWVPILLPHYQITDSGLVSVDGKTEPRPAAMLAALRLCDGKRTLAQIARASGISIAQLMDEAEGDGPLLLWPMHRPLRPHEQRDGGATGIILSPHLDDAPLSLGSKMLWTAGCRVIDVFSRVSWWRFPLSDEVLPLVQRTRDAEEDLIARLTTDRLAERWGLAEAPLRGYPLKEIFTTDRKTEAAATHEVIRARVRELATPDAKKQRWFLPLGVGNHIDHRIARDAALDGLRDAGVPAGQVEFYEDLPYAAQQPGVQDFSDFLAASLPSARLAVTTRYPVHPLKRRLLRAYRSQLTASQIESVYEYACRIDARQPCERQWGFDAATLARFGNQIPPLGPLG
jgi:LmbE family N-acetylglucosaminyl deacetylase